MNLPICKSMKIGDPCPRCTLPLERRKDSFYWRGTSSDAAYCRPCNSIWAIQGEEMEPLKPQGATVGVHNV